MQRIFAAAVGLVLLAACSDKPVPEASYDVIPLPKEIAFAPDTEPFILKKSTLISYPAEVPALLTEARHLQGYIAQLTGLKLEVADKDRHDNVIRLRADLRSDNPEGYTLSVSSDAIDINGSSTAGTFYGIQTLRKAIPENARGPVAFPAVNISDEPRFAYRGAHFDVSRHFFPEDSIKAFIDMLALHNINTFHWHLSDDQGWRIEIKSRPLLAQLGSKRPGTIIGHTNSYDSIPVEGFFTQDQIRDIIQYAADRHITIVPEIDLPGHMLAALHAYPELGCTGGPYEVWQRWGVAQDVLCAGNDSTYAFIDDVLGEVADLFPSQYIHIGGDECPKVRWEQCAKCQAKIVELGVVSDALSSKEEKLQSHVMKHASDFLASKGKKVIGWDETIEGGLAPGALVMSWRGEKGGIEAAKLGHDVIMTPNTYLYFDYYQSLDHDGEPEGIGGYVPLDKVYGYEPVTDRFTPEEAAHIIGVQANLWTEYIKTFSHAQYMELPRMAALSEVQWSSAPKDYEAFIARLPRMLAQYRANGYNYSTRAFDIVPAVSLIPAKRAVRIALSIPDNAPIHYTLDGSDPSELSPLYEGPVEILESAVFKAVPLRPDGPGRVYCDTVSFNKATARPVELLNPPAPNYSASGPQTLVDGIRGGKGYSSGGWLGFSGKDLVATVDLENEEPVSRVAIRTNVATGGWVFDARGLKVEVSDDAKSWRTVAAEQYPALAEPANGIFTHALSFAPVRARFIRVSVEAEKKIPAWHNAGGKPAFVFVDEIVVD